MLSAKVIGKKKKSNFKNIRSIMIQKWVTKPRVVTSVFSARGISQNQRGMTNNFR